MEPNNETDEAILTHTKRSIPDSESLQISIQFCLALRWKDLIYKNKWKQLIRFFAVTKLVIKSIKMTGSFLKVFHGADVSGGSHHTECMDMSCGCLLPLKPKIRKIYLKIRFVQAQFRQILDSKCVVYSAKGAYSHILGGQTRNTAITYIVSAVFCPKNFPS